MSLNSSPDKKKPKAFRRQSISEPWQRFIEPAASIQDDELRRLSRTLATLLIIILPLIILVGLVVMPLIEQAPTLWQSATFPPALLAAVVSILAYGLNRLGRYHFAVWFYVFVFVFSPWWAVVRNSSLTMLPIVILSLGGVMMAGILAPGPFVLYSSAVASVTGVLILPLTIPGVHFSDIAATLSVLVTLNSIILILSFYQNKLGHERQKHLQTANIDLKATADYADKRTTELIDAIINLSAMDFSTRAPIGENGDIYDALATGLNALGEELDATTISRAYLNEIITSMYDTLIVVSPDSTIQMVNRAAQALLGYAEAELIGQPMSMLFAGDTFERIGLDEIVETGVSRSMETKYRTKDGRFIPVLFSATVMRNQHNQLQGIVCVAQDIADRARAEEALRRSNRAYQTLSDCNQAVVRATDEIELMHDVCRIIVEVGGYRLAWVGFAEHDEAKTVRPVAQAGYEEGYLDTLHISWADNEQGRGPTGTSIRTGHPCINHNILTNPDFAPWRTEALRRGYTASIALPLLVDGQALGALNIYAAEPNAFDTKEVALLQELAGDLAYGITALRTQTEKEDAEEALRGALQETAHGQRLLFALSQAAQSVQLARTPDEIYHTIGDEVAGLGYQAAIVTITDDENHLALTHLTGETALIKTAEKLTGLKREKFRFPLHAGDSIASIVKDHKSVFTGESDLFIAEALPKRIRPLAGRLANMLGIKENIAAPLEVGGKFYGILFVFGQSLSEGDVPAVSTFANAAAIALENARLGQENRQQAQRLQKILDTIPDGILLLDSTHRVRLANPAGNLHLKNLTNIKVDDILTHLADYEVTTILESTTAGKLWHELEFSERREFYTLAAQPLEFGFQSGKGWVIIVRDVTEERMRLEYQQAQERLATVGQLAAGVAHDFNNIMAVISLYSELISKSSDLSPKNQARVTTLHQQSQRAANLINQILDFSRRSVMKRLPVDLVPFLKELHKLLERTVPENITIKLDYEKGKHVVNADPTRLQQAILNLSVNARDAMPEGGEIRIDLSRLQVKPGQKPPLPDMLAGHWNKLVVSDTGIGVEPQHQPHIFEPFYTTKPPGQGTGLGLAQVYGIVKQHDGHINFSSQMGRGTSFTIYLPAIELLATDTGLLEPIVEVAELPQGDGEIILVVEDNEATRTAIGDVLDMLGYQHLEAENGEEALTLYAEHAEDIALVLCDLVMPRMGGEALFKALSEQDPNVKMVIVTGYPLEEGGKALIEMGIVAWIQKPLSEKQIARTIAKVLDE